MATVYLTETVHLRDNWNRIVTPATGFSVSIDDTVHLWDNIDRAVDGTYQQIKYINDEVHLRDSYTRQVIEAGGLSVGINDEVHLRDSYTRDVSVSGVYRFLTEIVHLRDEYETEIIQSLVFTYNENISFGETKEQRYKEYSHRFRWTNYNGVAIPDLNYKDLKEPIVRMMPAPSFLQFEYANSFLLFTRNTINRFILTPDVETGQWRARTDNLIEEFKDLGLMAPKTLILAGDTLFGLSEKGVWKWNKKGMELISDKIIDLPDAGTYEYIAFYSSIRNQYILHRQESSGIYLQMTQGTPVSTTYPHQGSDTVFITDTKFVTIKKKETGAGGARQDTYVVMGEVSGNTVSYGTPLQIAVDGYATRSIIKMGDDKVLISYGATDGSKVLSVGNISGNTISITGTITVLGGSIGRGWLVKFSNTRFALFHNKTDYYTGTLSGNTITLDAEQSNWVASDATGISFKGAYVSAGKGFIMYRIIPATGSVNAFMRIISDNGDGTIDFGSVYDTGVAYNYFNYYDVAVASDTMLFTIFTGGVGAVDLILQPFEIDGTSLVAGTKTTKAGWVYGSASIGEMGIVNKGSAGFWLFWEDYLNSGYLTAMWGSGSETKMVLFEDTKTVVQSDETGTLEAIRIPGGQALLLYNDDGTAYSSGLANVWGIEYAAIDSFVYQIDRDKWGKFLGMDILDIPVILSGGSLDENYNLWLDSDRELKKYPGTAYTAVEAVIRTKEFYIEKGAFQRWMVDFEGSDVSVETRVHKMVSGSKTSEEDIKYNVTSNKFRGISLDKQRGYEMSIKIIDADILKGLSFDSKKWGEN